MRRINKYSLKTRLIADMQRYIAGHHKVCDVEQMAEKLVKFYFPKSNKAFVTTFILYAKNLLENYYLDFDFDSLIKTYK